MKCHFCNSDIPDGNTKCPKCGFDLPESEEENKTPQEEEIEDSQENSEPEEDLTPYKKKNYATVSSFKSSFKHKSVASYSAKLERQRKKEEEERERLEEENLNQDETSQTKDNSSYSSSFKTSSSTFNYGYNHENNQNEKSTTTSPTNEEATKEEPKSYFENSKFHYERADFSHKDYRKSYEASVKSTHNNTSLSSTNSTTSETTSSSLSSTTSSNVTTEDAATNKTTPTQDLSLNKVEIPATKQDDSKTFNSTLNDKTSLEVSVKIDENKNLNQNNNETKANVTLETKTKDKSSSSTTLSNKIPSSQAETTLPKVETFEPKEEKTSTVEKNTKEAPQIKEEVVAKEATKEDTFLKNSKESDDLAINPPTSSHDALPNNPNDFSNKEKTQDLEPLDKDTKSNSETPFKQETKKDKTSRSQGLHSIFRRKNKNSNKTSSNYEDESSSVVLGNNTYNSNTSSSTYTPNTYNPTNTTNDTYNSTSTTSSPTYNTNTTYSSNTTYNPNAANTQDGSYDVSFSHPKDTDVLENSNLFKANPVYDNTYVFKHDDLNEVQNVPKIDFYNIYFEEEFSKKIPENVQISYIAKHESIFQKLIDLWKDPDTYQKFQGAMGRSAQTFIVVDALSLMFNINYLAAFLFEMPLLFYFVKNLKAVSFEKSAQSFRNFLIEFVIHGVFFIGLLSYFNSMYDVDADADTKLYCSIIQWVLVADAIYLQAKTAFKFYKFYPRITQMKKLVIYFFDMVEIKL